MSRKRTYYRCLGEKPNGDKDYKVYQNPKDVVDWVESRDFVKTSFMLLEKQDNQVVSLMPITFEEILNRVGKIGFQPKGR
ncbi:MAG: hypothetical protein M0R51_18240 [Clostridia bacterium]|jgi:hypothetical protein|nr:hypothetical protein [Clostridia bacterium]